MKSALRVLSGFLALGLVGCASLPGSPENTDLVDLSPEVAREKGYIVATGDAHARGGLGVYVPRMSGTRKKAAQTAQAAPVQMAAK